MKLCIHIQYTYNALTMHVYACGCTVHYAARSALLACVSELSEIKA